MEGLVIPAGSLSGGFRNLWPRQVHAHHGRVAAAVCAVGMAAAKRGMPVDLPCLAVADAVVRLLGDSLVDAISDAANRRSGVYLLCVLNHLP